MGTELLLTYIGTILIAMEFVRKFTDLQALMGMIIGWPVSSLYTEEGLKNFPEIYKTHKANIIIRMTCSIMLCIITIPLTVAFYIIWFVILCLNSFQELVNRFYYEGKNKYRPFYKNLIRLNLSAYKRVDYKKYANISEKKGDEGNRKERYSDSTNYWRYTYHHCIYYAASIEV